MPAPAPTTGDRRPLASRSWPIMQRVAAALARAGVSPNAISLAGMVFGVAGGAALATTDSLGAAELTHITPVQRVLFAAAAVCVQLRLLCNLLDGMVAVEGGRASPVGELYNELPDRVSDAATLIGAGYALSGSPEAGFVAALFAVLTAYVRAVGKGAGQGSDFSGIMSKPRRMALMTAACVAVSVLPGAWMARLAVDVHNLHLPFMGVVLSITAIGSACTCLGRTRRLAAKLRVAGGR